MKAKKVYEFVQKKEIKAEIGNSVLQRRSIDEWFRKWAPGADYLIDDDLNITVDETLNLYKSKVLELPDNLTIINSLDLEETKIIKLPNNLKVGSNLFLRGVKIDKLPDD